MGGESAVSQSVRKNAQPHDLSCVQKGLGVSPSKQRLGSSGYPKALLAGSYPDFYYNLFPAYLSAHLVFLLIFVYNVFC